MRKSLLIALVALSAGMALPQSALANELPNREAERYEQNAQAALTSAETTLRKGTELAQRLTKMLNEARKDKRMADAIFLNRKLTEANAWVRNFEQASIRYKKAYESGNRADAAVNYNLMQAMVPQLEQIEDDVALYFDPNYKRAKQTTSDEAKTELKLPSPLLPSGGGGLPLGPPDGPSPS